MHGESRPDASVALSFFLILISAYLFVLTAVQNHVESNSDAHIRVVNTHGKIAFAN